MAFIGVGLALGMLGLGYAAVPLYDLFCRVTGFGGTTQVATEAQAATAAAQASSAGAPVARASRSSRLRLTARP